MAKSQLKEEVVCPFLVPKSKMVEGTKCVVLQQIMDGMSDTFFYRRNLVTDTYDYISPSCQQLFGISVSEISKMTVKEVLQQFIHPDDHTLLHEAIMHLSRSTTYSNKNGVVVEYRFKCQGGKYRWFAETLRINVDEKGVPTAIIGCKRDIDEIVQLRNSLHLSQQRFRNLYDNARIALFRSTIKGDRILECNNLFAWTMGFSNPAQCIEEFNFSQNCVEPAEFDKLVADICNSKVINKREIELRRKDGGVCWMSISAYWLDGISFGGSALNITAAKNLSEIEINILKLLLAGLSNKEIAVRLSRSRRTIEQHRASIMKKLNAQNLVDLAKHYLAVIL